MLGLTIKKPWPKIMSNSDPDLEYTRLHITPLNPSLLTTILPASILPSARNISYHSIQTFPEKSYGYVDLPMADAEKIKKKLNGSILKGTKVRIEKARPEKEAVVDDGEEVERPKKERRKRKRDQLEVPGIDIGERHVKRGWTTPGKDVKGKEKVAKSKFTTQPECLFKTVLPPNKVANAKGKLKKSKDKKKGKETVVHEFERTTKYATFLRAPGGKNTKGVVEFVEGKGWVDEDGNVVEIVKMRKAPAKVESKPTVKQAETTEEDLEVESKTPNDQTDETSSSDDSSSDVELEHKDLTSSIPISKVDEESSEESSSEDGSSEKSDHDQAASSSKAIKAASISSDESSEEESSSESEDEPEEPQSAITSRPQSSSGPGLTIKIPDSMTSTPISSSVHPLEALYKRKSDEQPKAGPSFSFFGDNEEEDIGAETHLQIPLTPFTQRDFEYRGMRSAAPTPDTAHPNKRFIWPTDKDDDDDDDDEEEASSPIRETKGKEKEAEPEGDFQKWFWENRGNVNRAWKKRRKVAAKEKRQRENRKRQDRAV